MRHAENERESHLAVGRIEVQPLVVGIPDVAEATGLKPEGSSRKVIVGRVPSIRRSADNQCHDVGEPQPDGDYEHHEWGAFSDICEWASRQRRKAFGAREHPGSKCSREHEHHSRDQCTLRHGAEGGKEKEEPHDLG